ncbi:MAG TPA: pentapeptide repeat-containing protein [Aldersonia sp.]
MTNDLVAVGEGLSTAQGTIIGASLAVLAAVVALLGVLITRHQTGKHFTGSQRAAREQLLRDRYSQTAAQLGSDSSAIRLAGVYAIASLADDWRDFGNDDERQVCVNVLCAYLRTPPSPSRAKDLMAAEAADHREQQVRDTAVAVIRSRAQAAREGSAAGKWSGLSFDLTGADLSQVDLTGVDLTGATLKNAHLTDAKLGDTKLGGAELGGADLSRASLGHAHLAGANLDGTDLSDAYLRHANLTDATLNAADILATKLMHADLTRADLRSAKLLHANLSGATLRDTKLDHAKLDGTDLTGATLGGTTDVSRANWEEEPIWPTGFTPPRPRR